MTQLIKPVYCIVDDDHEFVTCVHDYIPQPDDGAEAIWVATYSYCESIDNAKTWQCIKEVAKVVKTMNAKSPYGNRHYIVIDMRRTKGL